jgi:hypothetical protein
MTAGFRIIWERFVILLAWFIKPRFAIFLILTIVDKQGSVDK